ncbi:aminotransferase class I/II-fold pyridoxal phosphate-dependent enzyme [Pasteurella skyensis]|uniref:cysteine-S-conjugate beta-lyase n=1 Tax=Phocoenobacter skyensis TaxID=97481 RepID=A0AAJ6NAS5_9PAST|nr:aminotransferase class I/II-fold pyridoxal phosphate-dependent enzyme [Pasteurella skyensis]MDP8162770.1 aminotransferase class I/II-fold pyridoxal phosphate-dependent enzyme [Pasteurella skyensis]MDP8173241.1 aminotransferase class I/II-fold pyridoxal phosphate-dependent enzyme [Pasteurella skyensis]MDP8177542.1 aminotransferase class I/II-fold pyridoxal phosphate-dependent enzyme [Pasteurella skyensis]MDP8178872.1 aminotransferase class I/II-fold pyridoxal phosphate-dependent enzyme [Paste
MKFGTQVLHGYNMLDPETGASSISICQASTFHQKEIDNLQKYMYSRFGNPTREALEEAIASLEKGKYAVAFASGVAAISAVLLIFSKGDHIVMCKDVYGGTFQLVSEVLPRFGIEVSFVDETDLTEWEKAIKPNTKAFYMETPSNPTLKITDIQGVVEIAKKHNVLTIIDNTFMTPQYQQPLTMGVDIVIQSATKFLNGHSDVILGAVVVNDEGLYEKLHKQQIMLGGLPGIEESWLVMRGIKTMAIRMEKSTQTALKIAQLLENHPKVKKVYYPGLESHEGYEIHKKQASSGGAVLSFDLGSIENTKKFTSVLEYPIVAVSLGGVESILSYPAKMSHASVPEEERLKQGITEGLVRLSVGIEDTDDLIEDIKNALDNI